MRGFGVYEGFGFFLRERREAGMRACAPQAPCSKPGCSECYEGLGAFYRGFCLK